MWGCGASKIEPLLNTTSGQNQMKLRNEFNPNRNLWNNNLMISFFIWNLFDLNHFHGNLSELIGRNRDGVTWSRPSYLTCSGRIDTWLIVKSHLLGITSYEITDLCEQLMVSFASGRQSTKKVTPITMGLRDVISQSATSHHLSDIGKMFTSWFATMNGWHPEL